MKTLIISKDVFFIPTVESLLKEYGRSYITFSEDLGEKSLEAMGQGGVDMVILDLPPNGLFALKELKSIRNKSRKVWLVVAVAAGDRDYLQKALSYGANDFFLKPVDRERFASCLKTASSFMMQEAGCGKNDESAVAAVKSVYCRDELTGFYNEAYFNERLQMDQDPADYPVTIVYADIDSLDFINKILGRAMGDFIIKEAARVMMIPLRRSDTLVRLGSDEFAAILAKTDEEAAESICERIQETFDYYCRSHPGTPLSISIGAATCSEPGGLLFETLKQAERQVYREQLNRSAATHSKIVKSLLTTLAERDYISQGHTLRLQELCRKMGSELNLDPKQLSDLDLLAQVHDLGKVAIPEAVLFKKEPLTGEEIEIIRQHSEKGYHIARSSQYLSAVADLILRHHEMWDGKGYPLGLKGTEIPIECRILAIADAYDAMTNIRPHRGEKSREEAIAELKGCAGAQFDPELVDLFVSMQEIYL